MTNRSDNVYSPPRREGGNESHGRGMTNVVVVESPAKARTINKYLGSGYTVVASYGHVRDLPAKDGSVRPDDDFEMDWEIAKAAEQRLREIAKAVKGADRLYLATDPDREGEAISWHVHEVLRARNALGHIIVKRVVFNEVTKSAVLNAIANPRELNRELIEAYLARRALDYLVGFTLSPVLWRKLPGARSAGRVQSVALRMICEREAEIEAFRPQEYWTVDVAFANAAGQRFTARLSRLDGGKLEKLSIGDEAAARAAVAAIEARDFAVAGIERKTLRRRPQPPSVYFLAHRFDQATGGTVVVVFFLSRRLPARCERQPWNLCGCPSVSPSNDEPPSRQRARRSASPARPVRTACSRQSCVRLAVKETRRRP